MIVGVPAETAPGERRVALVPRAVQQLRARHAIEVLVQRGAGVASGHHDAAYRRAGARVVDAWSTLARHATLLAWVKPPTHDLAPWMAADEPRALVGFLDPLHAPTRLAALVAGGVRVFAHELLPPAFVGGEYDALLPMSRLAGRLALEEALRLLAGPARQRDPVRVLVLGAGTAASSAIRAAARRGHEVAVASRGLTRAPAPAQCVHRLPPRGERSQRDAVLGLVRSWQPHVVIAATQQRGQRAPRLLGRAALAALPSDAIVVDLAGKAGGVCRATRVDRTVALARGIRVVHRSNYPAQEPRAASAGYSAAMVAILGLLLQHDAGGHDRDVGPLVWPQAGEPGQRHSRVLGSP
jgi:NAD/NADP transhydrogenase alpha subunit